ncbi:hypothetical protein DFH11DRAFT_1560610, partial [Phellopilus nigrolimitatus]
MLDPAIPLHDYGVDKFGSYKVIRTGLNYAGNAFVKLSYGPGFPELNTYHYYNANGSYYHNNPDGSQYFNNGRGYEWSRHPPEEEAKPGTDNSEKLSHTMDNAAELNTDIINSMQMLHQQQRVCQWDPTTNPMGLIGVAMGSWDR